MPLHSFKSTELMTLHIKLDHVISHVLLYLAIKSYILFLFKNNSISMFFGLIFDLSWQVYRDLYLQVPVALASESNSVSTKLHGNQYYCVGDSVAFNQSSYSCQNLALTYFDLTILF